MMARPHLPLRLSTTRRSMLLLLLGSAAFVVAGFFVLPTHPVLAEQAIVFFGLGVLVAVIQLLPNSSYLEVDERGFTTCTMFRKGFVSWDDVAEFVPYTVNARARKRVGFRYAASYQAHAASRKFLRALAGVDGALPDTYGRSAEDLAALLNGLRAERAHARS